MERKSMVQVPAPTMGAISRLLCKNAGGVNITTLVDALAPGRNRDLVAVQVAIAMNGILQEASKEDRFRIETSNNTYSPKTVIYKLSYKATGIFDNKVTYTSEVIFVDNSNLTEKYRVVDFGSKAEKECTIETWENEFLSEVPEKYTNLVGTFVPFQAESSTPRKPTC